MKPVLYVGIKELTIVRVKCLNTKCGWIAELPIENLSKILATDDSKQGPLLRLCCRICGESKFKTGDTSQSNPLNALAQAIAAVEKLDDFAVEFIIPHPSEKQTDAIHF